MVAYLGVVISRGDAAGCGRRWAASTDARSAESPARDACGQELFSESYLASGDKVTVRVADDPGGDAGHEAVHNANHGEADDLLDRVIDHEAQNCAHKDNQTDTERVHAHKDIFGLLRQDLSRGHA